MRHPRGFGSALAGLLASLLALVAVLQQAAALAQATVQGATVTVGTSSVTYADAWSVDPAASNNQGLLLNHQQLPGTQFLYVEYDEPQLQADAVINDAASSLFGTFGDGNHELVTVGGTTSIIDSVETRLAWQLYSVTDERVPFGVLIAADPTSLPGRARVSVLVSPVESFGPAAQAVLDGIVLNGVQSPLLGWIRRISPSLAHRVRPPSRRRPSPLRPRPRPAVSRCRPSAR